jgi:hypothetical protein
VSVSPRSSRQHAVVVAAVLGALAWAVAAGAMTPRDTTGVHEPAPAAGVRDSKADEEERLRLKETLQRMGRREVEGERQWQRRKSGKVAMLSSALLPGLGQVYNGRRIKVAVMVGVASGYIAQIWLNTKNAQRARALRDRLEPGTSQYRLQNRLSEFYEDEARTWVWWTGAVWMIGILDAWTDAHLYDIRVYTPPGQDELTGSADGLPGVRPIHYLTVSVGL